MILQQRFFENTPQTTEITLTPGVYKIECWGGEGRSGEGVGGKGAYVAGYIRFNSKETLYIYVGGRGLPGKDGAAFNGGGLSQSGGGGASDVRILGGEWDDFNSLKSRIIVAGAGGGADGYILNSSTCKDTAGSGGGLFGFNSLNEKGFGGTQTQGGYGNSSGSFGKGGGNGRIEGGSGGSTADGNGAGGSGYFGGGGSIEPRYYAGGGGSSYISGYNGCRAINPLSTENNIMMLNHSIHSSGKQFFMMVMIDGNSLMPSPNNNDYEKGHSGDGAVRISYVILQFNVTCLGFKSRMLSLFIFVTLF